MNVSLGCVPEAYIPMVMDTVNAEIRSTRLKHTYAMPSDVLGDVSTNGGCMVINNAMQNMHCITRVVNVLCSTDTVLGGATETGQGPNLASMLSATMRPNTRGVLLRQRPKNLGPLHPNESVS